MAIKIPGRRDRRGRLHGAAKRSVVAVLQLTAMVDMFTVMAVFLLQNYAVTGQVIYIPKEVTLPDAASVKELKPANVVIISDQQGIMLNNAVVADFKTVKNQQDWMVESLRKGLEEIIAKGEKDKTTLGSQIRKAVSTARTGKEGEEEAPVDEFRRITIQSDKQMDFLTVKKIMYTVTEAGMHEINFAVIKKDQKPGS
jgi:biopolymer transport protein ExbD